MDRCGADTLSATLDFDVKKFSFKSGEPEWPPHAKRQRFSDSSLSLYMDESARSMTSWEASPSCH